MAIAPSASAGPEVVPFYPTPARLETLFKEGLENEPEFQEKVESLFDGQVERWDREEIASLMVSDENQLALTELILARSDAIQEQYPGFDPQNVEALQQQLEVVGDTLQSMDRWEVAMTEGEVQAAVSAPTEELQVEAQQELDKKGILRRALGVVGKFYKKHPVVASLLTVGTIAAAAAGGTAAGTYLTGNWAELTSTVALAARKVGASLGMVAEVTEPITPALPGAGAEGLGGLETVVSP